MNKTELINALSEETMFSKKDIARLLDALSRIVIRTLRKGDKLQWSGLGTFTVTRRAARKGINPMTKEPIDLEERYAPQFKAAKNFKERIKTISSN